MRIIFKKFAPAIIIFASILVFTDFVGAAGAAMTTLEIKLSLFKIACLTLRTLSNGVPIL